MLREGDSACFATFRMKVLAALAGLEVEPVYRVTQEQAQRAWTNTAKAATQSLERGQQHRDVYSLALIQLEQQREVTLTGALRKLMTKSQHALQRRSRQAHCQECWSAAGWWAQGVPSHSGSAGRQSLTCVQAGSR